MVMLQYPLPANLQLASGMALQFQYLMLLLLNASVHEPNLRNNESMPRQL